jgi:general secretion pathway protein L
MTAAMTILYDPVSRFLHWWGSELKACVPGSGRATGSAASRVVLVRMQSDHVLFDYRTAKGHHALGRVALDQLGSHAGRRELAKMKAKARTWGTKVALCLEPDHILQVRTCLPLATEENLREVIGLEMERLTTFREDEVFYAHRVTEVDRAEKRIGVVITVAPRVAVESALEMLRGCGIKVQIVTVDAENRAIDLTQNLVESPAVKVAAHGAIRLVGALTAIALCLGAALVYLEFRQQAELIAAYEEQVAQTRAAAADAEQLREQLVNLIDRSSYVAQRKIRQPLLNEVMNETTRTLPDNTWVAQLQLRGDQLTITGYSAAASNLIEALEASPMFSQVKFTSPITPDPKLGVERFMLSASVEPEVVAP